MVRGELDKVAQREWRRLIELAKCELATGTGVKQRLIVRFQTMRADEQFGQAWQAFEQVMIELGEAHCQSYSCWSWTRRSAQALSGGRL
ncbi:hypothetical protein DBR42_18870 [Pelomonas sp. HMWF004]|nr:hypothetical protein DBR42_18870 [Pelomonas sp. HMWF004]